jgi:hypothetical protein
MTANIWGNKNHIRICNFIKWQSPTFGEISTKLQGKNSKTLRKYEWNLKWSYGSYRAVNYTSEMLTSIPIHKLTIMTTVQTLNECARIHFAPQRPTIVSFVGSKIHSWHPSKSYHNQSQRSLSTDRRERETPSSLRSNSWLLMSYYRLISPIWFGTNMIWIWCQSMLEIRWIIWGVISWLGLFNGPWAGSLNVWNVGEVAVNSVINIVFLTNNVGWTSIKVMRSHTWVLNSQILRVLKNKVLKNTS